MNSFYNRAKQVFSHKNFKYSFFSQIFALLGVNMQLVAITWLAYTLSASEFILGLIVSMQYLPILFFGIYAGHITDKFSKYEFLKWIQIVQVVIPFVIFLALYFGFINLYIVTFAAVAFGFIRVFDAPLRHSFLSYIVPKEDIKSAFSMASMAGQTARVMGPAIGGVSLAYFGASVSFLATAIGYLFVVVLYRQMDTKLFHIDHKVVNEESTFKDSIKYVYSHKRFREISMIGIFLGIFFWSYPTYYPIIAKTIFGLGAKEFSLMISAYAIGSILGGIYSTRHEDTSPKHLRNLSILFAILSSVMVFIPNFYVMLGFIVIMGSLVSQLNIITNAIVRTESDEKFLGTAVSLWMVITIGMTGIGSLYYGLVSEYFGIYVAVFVPPIFYFFYAIFYLRRE